jgi:hypothetical protein
MPYSNTMEQPLKICHRKTLAYLASTSVTKKKFYNFDTRLLSSGLTPSTGPRAPRNTMKQKYFQHPCGCPNAVHNNTEHNDIQHISLLLTLSILSTVSSEIMMNIITLSVTFMHCYAKCRYAQCH